MQTPQKNPKYRGTTRLRDLAALALLLASMALIPACGGGEEGGNSGGGGGNAEKQGNGEQAANDAGGANGGDTGGKPAKPKKDAPPISDARVIFATPNKEVLNGARARLKDAEVRTIVSERAFFIGENDAERILVLNVGDAVEVNEGQQALVAGRLNVPRPNLEEKLSLTPEEATAVNDQDVFLRASRVKPQEG